LRFPAAGRPRGARYGLSPQSRASRTIIAQGIPRMSVPSPSRLGPYEVRATLGRGGMGEVYLAEDTRLKRLVAIKILVVDSDADEHASRRLIREAQAAAALDHPNICSIYEVGEQDGRAFIVMQYVEGETLAARIQRQRLATSEILEITISVADGLAEAPPLFRGHHDPRTTRPHLQQPRQTNQAYSRSQGTHRR